jgi:hypothetical protein
MIMGDLWFVIIVTSAICGLIGHAYGKHAGRNPRLWAALGVAFNLFGLAYVCRPRRRR